MSVLSHSFVLPLCLCLSLSPSLSTVLSFSLAVCKGLFAFGSLFNHSCEPNTALLKRDEDLDDTTVRWLQQTVTGAMRTGCNMCITHSQCLCAPKLTLGTTALARGLRLLALEQ